MNLKNISKLSISILTIIILTLPKTSFANNISNNHPHLKMPLICDYGKDCFIQNYVDLDKSSNYQDYNCNKLSYNNHKGTDFRLLDFSHLKKEIKVISALDGIVKNIRDGEDDFKYYHYKEAKDKSKKLTKDTVANPVKNKECGNGIIIESIINNSQNKKDIYNLQYCHLLKNSIKVKENQKVKKGQIIASIGMSGKTEFAHLHLSIRKNGKIIDPFTSYYKDLDSCKSSKKRTSIWQDDLPYIKSAILNLNITDKIPNSSDARNGLFRENIITKDSKNIIIWVDIMGVEKKDKIIFEIIAPNKKNILYNKIISKEDYALNFLYNGTKISKNFLNLFYKNKKQMIGKANKQTTKETNNKYKAKVTIFRKNEKILEKEKIFQINL